MFVSYYLSKLNYLLVPSSKNTPPSIAQYFGHIPFSPDWPTPPGGPGAPGLPSGPGGPSGPFGPNKIFIWKYLKKTHL